MSCESVMVSAEWLYQNLHDPDVAIADCRFSLADADLGQRQYQEGHIPGAYFFDLNRDLSSPVQSHGGRHPLPNMPTFAQKLSQIGLISDTPEPKLVVAYDASRLAFAARFWWLLRYAGYDRVAVLDGGLQAWVDAGYPLSQEEPAPQPGNFVPHLRTDWTVDIAGVKARSPETVLVDSREGDRYRGEREPIDPIAGHIPGAVNYPWQEVTDEQGYGRSPEAQRQRWQAVQEAEDIIVYCGSGVTACVNLLSLELAGIKTGKLYPGSWSDWCSYLV